MDKSIDIERAWKDEEYRKSLTPEQLAKLPPNPAGDVELNEEDLDEVSGGLSQICSFKAVNTRQAQIGCL